MEGVCYYSGVFPSNDVTKLLAACADNKCTTTIKKTVCRLSHRRDSLTDIFMYTYMFPSSPCDADLEAHTSTRQQQPHIECTHKKGIKRKESLLLKGQIQ